MFIIVYRLYNEPECKVNSSLYLRVYQCVYVWAEVVREPVSESDHYWAATATTATETV